MSLLWRIIVILFAVWLATIAAGMTFSVALLSPQSWSGPDDPVRTVMFWFASFFSISFTGSLVFLPAMIMVVLGEAFKIRSAIVHGIAGAALLLLGFYGSGFVRPSYEESVDAPPPPASRSVQLVAAAGVVFGFTYWLVAGRKAGRWREPRQPSA